MGTIKLLSSAWQGNGSSCAPPCAGARTDLTSVGASIYRKGRGTSQPGSLSENSLGDWPKRNLKYGLLSNRSAWERPDSRPVELTIDLHMTFIFLIPGKLWEDPQRR